MAVQVIHQALGQWSVQLVPDAPPGIIAGLPMFGRIVIVPSRVSPVEYGDDLLRMARYVGVLRTVGTDSQITLSGSGMSFWLGDDNGLGDVFETPGVTLTAATFPTAIRALLPPNGAITEGTLHTGVPGTITNPFAYQTPKAAIDYVCKTMGGSWRVNGDATLDAGPESALFVTTPTSLIVRKESAGYDVTLKALSGDLSSTRDATNYTTRVVLIAAALAGGTADAPLVPYLDPQGNPVHITRVIDEQADTLIANAPARAQAALAQYNGINRSIQLSVDEYDVAGDFAPGDTVWVYDPDAGIFDTANEMPFRGALIYPMAIKVLSLTWPVTEGHTVAYRSGDGIWTDLTSWVAWEAASGGEVEVADSLLNPLTSAGSTLGTQVAGVNGGLGDATVPGTPVFGAFSTQSYQPADGLAKAAVTPTWTQPLNVDSSTITDGDHYEVRYRVAGGATDWQSVMVAWDQTSATVVELSPGTSYEWQIRAADTYSPTNYSAWSATTTYSSSADTTAPSTPAAPTVDSSLISVQVTHTLGKASGGTYNLELDTQHFRVHVGTSSGFTASAVNLVGLLAVGAAPIIGHVPVVGTFAVDTLVAAGATAYVRVVAVDHAGNASPASAAAAAVPDLIDSAHISDLTASKITAGSITAAVVIGGSATFSGALSAATGTFAGSLSAATGTFAGSLSAASGSFTGSLSGNSITGATITGGTFQTASSGQRIVIDPSGNGTIYFYPSSGSDYAFINAPSSNSVGANSGTGGGSNRTRLLATPSFAEMMYMTTSQVQNGGRLYVDSGGVNLSGSSSGASLGLTSSSASLTGVSSLSCTTASGTALFGAGNNTYVQCNGTTTYLSGQGGGTSINMTSTTVTISATAFKAAGIVSTGNAATMYYDTASWQLYYHTSSRTVKEVIEPADPELLTVGVLQLQPITFYDKRDFEAVDRDVTRCSRQLGLIAEDVELIPGLGDLLIEHHVDHEGNQLPPGLSYERGWIALLPGFKDLLARVTALETTQPGRP